MKFRVVEDWDRLQEASREITKAFSNKISQTCNPSGSKKLNNKIIIAHKLPILRTNNYYVLHHRNGNHEDNSEGNVWIIPNTCHSRIHELIRDEIEEQLKPSKDQKIELDYLASIKQINTFIERLNTLKKNIPSISEQEIVFKAPTFDSEISNKYSDLLDPENFELKDICCKVFDNYFRKNSKIQIAQYNPELI